MSCTDNPFEQDITEVENNRSIAGAVRLLDQQQHDGVYLWMNGFNLGSSSRSDGNFSLTLPPPAQQGEAGGISGGFTLYSFLGNYKLARASVAVRDGVFLFPSEDVDDGGRFYETMTMPQLFSIEMALDKPAIEADSPRVITVRVSLQSDNPPARVYYPLVANRIQSPLLLHNLHTGAVSIMKSAIVGSALDEYIQVGRTPYTRTMLLIIPKYLLQAGDYELIPYLYSLDQSVPDALLESLGVDPLELTEGYVHYPFLRQGGILSVR